MSWTFVVLALVLFLFAIYIGFLCGQWACEKRVITKRDYWIANFAGAAAVVLLTWVFSLFPLVQFAPIGWLTAPPPMRATPRSAAARVTMARPTDSSSRSPMTARVLASTLRNSKKR